MDGEEIICDLDKSQHLKNVGGSDGAGLCVFCSIDHAARWANEPALIGFRDYMTKYPGGGYPSKVDQYIKKMCAEKNLPIPPYIQHTGGDAEFLKLALKTGRYVCVTYDGRDGVFYNGSIAHMVNLVHLSDKWAVIHDNNYPGKWLWLSPSEFLSRWRGNGGGWAVVLLKAGPPPIPVNKADIKNARNEVVMIDYSSDVAIESPAIVKEVDNLYWTPDSSDPRYKYLYDKKSGKQVGTWYPETKIFQYKVNDTFVNVPAVPPIEVPGNPILNFGVDTSKIDPKPSYSFSGSICTRNQAFQAVGDNLIDDSGLYRLTIVHADKNVREKIKSDLNTNPALVSLKDKFLVQDYAPDHWAVTGVGLATGITLQAPAKAEGKGLVIWRQREYEGPEQLAGALRKIDPSYDPNKDKTGKESDKSGNIDVLGILKKVPNFVWFLLVGGVGIYFYNKKGK